MIKKDRALKGRCPLVDQSAPTKSTGTPHSRPSSQIWGSQEVNRGARPPSGEPRDAEPPLDFATAKEKAPGRSRRNHLVGVHHQEPPEGSTSPRLSGKAQTGTHRQTLS